MVRVVLWIVGAPGLGKTTIARSLLTGRAAKSVSFYEKPKWSIQKGGKVVAAGHYTGQAFDGADTLSYSGGQEALDFWWKKLAKKAELTILDGDRLSNAKTVTFFREIYEGGEVRSMKLRCVHLVADEDVARNRRELRAEGLGVPYQNETWVKGRVTKSRNFYYNNFRVSERLELDASDRSTNKLLNLVENFL